MNNKNYFSRQKHDFSLIDKEVKSILLKKKHKSKSKSRSKSKIKRKKSKLKHKKKLLKIFNEKIIQNKKIRNKSLKKPKKAKIRRIKSKAKKYLDCENMIQNPKIKLQFQKIKKKKIRDKSKIKKQKNGKNNNQKFGSLIKNKGVAKKKDERPKIKLSELKPDQRKLNSTVSVKQILKLTNEIRKKTKKYGVDNDLGRLVEELRKMVKGLNNESYEESQNKSSSGNVMNYNINNFQNINNIKNLK
jgi:hypothetical protein